ncbi:MAG: hypothetical protein FJ319_13730 [SAR202 cluster bacterium]|nr:hypothetical protein [SAR202 cluster bacterium]
MRFMRTVTAYVLGFGSFIVIGVGCMVAFGKFADARVAETRPDAAMVIFAVTIAASAAMMWGSWEMGREREL